MIDERTTDQQHRMITDMVMEAMYRAMAHRRSASSAASMEMRARNLDDAEFYLRLLTAVGQSPEEFQEEQ